MNSETPPNPREELEIRLTALLMGELTPEEAATLHAQMAADPELAALHARLRQAMELLREASALPEHPAPPVPAQLSNERRERLLAHFKGVSPAPAPIDEVRRRDWSWVVPLGLAASLIALLGGTVLMEGFPLSVLGGGSAAPHAFAVDGEKMARDEGGIPAAAGGWAESEINGRVTASATPARDYDRTWVFSPPTTAVAWSGAGRSALATPAPESRAAGRIDGLGLADGSAPAAPAGSPVVVMKGGSSAAPLPEAVVKPKESTAERTRAGVVNLGTTATISGNGAGIAGGPNSSSATDSYFSFMKSGGTDQPRQQMLGENGDKLGDTSGARATPEISALTVAPPQSKLLSGVNTYSGATTISGGTVAADPGQPLGWYAKPERFGVTQMDRDADKLDRVESFKGKKSEVAKEQIGQAPELKQMEKALEESPTFYNKTITPKFRGNVEEVKKDFAEAGNFFDSGRYDLALKRTEQILTLDPYNIAARKLQEKVNKAVDDYGVAAGNETRANAVRNLDKAWANPIRHFTQPVGQVVSDAKPDSRRAGQLEQKLERIVIPRVEFKDATIQEAVEFLKEKSRSLDTTEPNAAKRGVDIALKLDGAAATPYAAFSTTSPAISGLETLPGAALSPGEAPKSEDARITVSLSDIPLSEALRYVANLGGLKYKVDADSVSLVPASVNTDTVVTREFKVRPDLIGRGQTEDVTKGGAGVAKREAAKDWLISNGLTFGPQASAIYIPSSGKLIVRNTEEQLDLVESIVSAGESAAPAEKPAPEPREPEAVPRNPSPEVPEPQPEVSTSANAFSTFSLNVSDVAFKLAAASLEQGKMPDLATVRSEEFINAFDYCDPEPAAGTPLAFASEHARYPFAQNRDLLRLSVKTAAAGRQPGRALNIVLLLDNSGSMERADRVGILREALRVLCEQLQPQDKLSVVTFSRTPRLWADGVAGDKAAEVTARVGEITPQGGTNLDAALDLGYATALKHYQVGSINRVVLLTDGAANLGDVNPDALKKKVEAHRKQGVALDCFGIGWEGLDDTVLEALSRHGDGRYGFINTPEEAATEFAGQLAGALRVAASDVKVQVEFNPRRVTAYRQIGYAKHQLTKEQFRDNTVDAAEIGAAESGNALYAVEVNPRGEGDLATVRVRFKVPGTDDYREHEWTVPFTPNAPPLEQASPALRLAGTASAFSEWLVRSPYAGEVTPDRLLSLLNGVPAIYGADPRPQKLEWMIRQAKSVSGR